MIKLNATPRVRVVVSYSNRWDQGMATEFRDGVSSLLVNIESQLRVENPSLNLEPIFTTSFRAISQSDLAGQSALALLDVTDYDEDQALLIGLMQGARTPLVLMCQSEEMAQLSALADYGVVPYESLTALFRNAESLRCRIAQAISQKRVLEQLVYEIWFPRDTTTIWVVCPQIHQPSEFADRSNPDYTYLDNLGDTDALLEIMVFLSRYYPTAIIERFSADDLPGGHTNNNLVVIGGPGSCEEISNHVCQEMMSLMNSRVSYSADCEKMIVNAGNVMTVELMADLHESGAMRRDYGYFARFQNPLNEAAAVVLVNGIHTAGVLGAAKAFGDRRESLRNYHLVFSSTAEAKSFECYFQVPVVNRNVKIPNVQADNIYPLGSPQNGDPDTRRLSQRDSLEAGQRHSVTVLFVAGDRGGLQQNQIQIPKELESIKEAIRGSEYRGHFNLAVPILAVTHENLVAAYRERPVVLHIAGHGNDRSLSILSEQGLLVSQTALLKEQLAAILGSFPERVFLCVFNTCHSSDMAEYLVRENIVKAAIGWPGTLDDSKAITFARLLYGRLGDGLSLSQAVALANEGCGSHQHAMLHGTPEVLNLNAVTFVDRSTQ
jgi:hypothetical protein